MRSRNYLAFAGSVAISLCATRQAVVLAEPLENPAGTNSASRVAVLGAIVSAEPQVPGIPAPGVPAPGVPAPGVGLPAGGVPAAGAGVAPAAGLGAAPQAAGVVPQRSIWGFLGLPPTFQSMGDRMHTKCDNVKAKMETTPLCQMVSAMAEPWLALVGLNHGPPPIGSEALMNSTNPAIKDSAAVQEANAIKQQEDAAPAKIEAIKYLAGVDCKCYPGVKKALLEALKDCNEGVRFEAAKALGSACCCDKEVAKILEEVANKQDQFGNYKEWSVRVRAAAAQSMASCAGIIPKETEVPDETPPKGEVPPIGEVPQRPQASRSSAPREKQETVAATKPESSGWFKRDKKPEATEKATLQPPLSSVTRASREEMKPSSSNPFTVQSSTPPTTRNSVAQANSESKATLGQPAAKPAVHIESIETKDDGDGANEIAGTVTYVDVKTGSLRINFADGEQPRPGTHVDVFHKYLLRTQHLGELEIMGTSDGVTLARPSGDLTIRQVSKGDRVVVRK